MCGIEARHTVDSRFQRSLLENECFPGALPQALNERAPLALNSRLQRGLLENECFSGALSQGFE
jgi:hypothetical protein